MKSLTTSTTTQNVAMGVTGSATFAVLLVGLVRSFLPEAYRWDASHDELIAAGLTAIFTPFVSRWIAIRREPEKAPGGIFSNTPPPSAVIACFLGAALALSGCATTLPAVGGKTHYNVEFSDVTAEQATNYKMNIRAPAGVELASMTGMQYNWKPDGSGEISVSQDQTSDSTAQAALISEVNRQQVEVFRQILDTTLSALAPFLGQYLDARVREGEIEADVANNAIEAARSAATR